MHDMWKVQSDMLIMTYSCTTGMQNILLCRKLKNSGETTAI